MFCFHLSDFGYFIERQMIAIKHAYYKERPATRENDQKYSTNCSSVARRIIFKTLRDQFLDLLRVVVVEGDPVEYRRQIVMGV